MAKPTEEQVKAFEKVHKLQLFDILAANHVFIGTLKLYQPIFKADPNYKTSAKYKKIMAYGEVIKNMAKSWYARQLQFEIKAGVPKFPNIWSKFFQEKYMKEVERIGIDYILGRNAVKGIGIIPLIIWGVIAIVGAFSAAYIVDETTETNAERGDLLEKTKKFAQEMKLTPEQTTQIVQGQQASEQAQTESTSGGGFFGGSIMKIGGLALIAFLIMNKKQSN